MASLTERSNHLCRTRIESPMSRCSAPPIRRTAGPDPAGLPGMFFELNSRRKEARGPTTVRSPRELPQQLWKAAEPSRRGLQQRCN